MTETDELVRGLEPAINALRRLDGRRRALELALFVGLFVGGAGLVTGSLLWAGGATAHVLRALGTIAAVIGLNAQVLLLHEGMHGVLLPSPRWNRWVSVALGAPVLMSFSAYRVMHLRHHRYLGDPRDPDDYHNYTDSPTWIWVLHYTRLASGAFLYLLLIPFLSLRSGTPAQRRDVLVEYALLGVLWVSAATWIPWPILFGAWLLPALITGLLVNLRGFCQHGMADAQDPFLASRSIMANRVVAFVLLNENLHLEHHLFPEVPSHNLPALRRLLVERYPRQVVGHSYVGILARFFAQSVARDETPIGLVGARAGRLE